jgi:nickel-dependent lactate racemase
MKASFSFGKRGIDVTVPDSFQTQVIQSRTGDALVNEPAALNHSLDNPIGCPPLKELATGKKTAAISVCDITRPAPNAVTLLPVLERLHAAGIPTQGVTILIATGLHRAATDDAKTLSEHRYLGETRRGTPVHIDERFVAADLHITLGFIEQHLMLGFSGGRKLIAPGLAAQETIKVLHSPKFMREPLATEGSIADNPLHAELLEIARMARHDFALDVTLTKGRHISGVFAGEPVKSHAAGVAFVEHSCLERLDEPVDAVITSAAGYPLDLTFYQIVKGLTAAAHVVKPGGRILTIAQCAEGVGSPEFARKLAAMKDFKSLLDALKDSPVEVDQWQLEKLALVGDKYEIFFYTPGVTVSQLGVLGERSFRTIDEAVMATLAGLPADARVAMIPKGPYTFVRAEEPVGVL